MRLELVNLEQCHLSLSQMLTVFNSITESEDLQLRELHITGNHSLPLLLIPKPKKFRNFVVYQKFRVSLNVTIN